MAGVPDGLEAVEFVGFADAGEHPLEAASSAGLMIGEAARQARP